MLAPNHSPMDDCRNAHLRRYSLGATPVSRLKTRLKELSDPYPTADATSQNDVLLPNHATCFVHPPLGKVFERCLAQNDPEF